MADSDRLRWRCRRGLLELDLVLAAFTERHLDRLNAHELDLFAELLELPDNDLLDVVMERAELEDRRFAGLLALMRSA